MPPISYARHRFPPVVIQHAVWLYLRFTLSYRDVEDLLAERGLEVSFETVRRWVLKFGPVIARNLRRRRPKPSPRWHLDEMAVRIGEVQRRRDKHAARKLMRKLLRKQGFAPTVVTTDKLRSYGAAFAEIGLTARHERGLRKNNRAEVSHQPLRRRERKMQGLTGCGKSHDRRALKADSSPRWKRISPVSDPSGASLAEPAPEAGSISSKPSQVKRTPSGP